MEFPEIKVDAVFEHETVYNVDMLTVDVGQSFSLRIEHHHPKVRWFADNDMVLSITTVSGDTYEAFLTATAVGKSELIVKHQREMKKFFIHVRPKQGRAVTLGLNFSTPEEK